MNTCDWVICERSGRWEPAARVAVSRLTGRFVVKLTVVRRLSEAAAQLVQCPECLTLIETRAENVADVLVWLTNNRDCYPKARFVAALDGPVNDEGYDLLSDALRAAGVAEIAASPRHLGHVLQLVGRSAFTVPSAKRSGEHSFTEWAWRQLPWQDAMRPVG